MDDGDLVKTKNFSNQRYIGDPINAVKIFNEKKVDELTIFDISCSVRNSCIDFDLLSDIAKEARMPLCYGGGVNDPLLALELVKMGFEKVSLSSHALDNPELLDESSSKVGSQSIVLTVDYKINNGDINIFINRGNKKLNLNFESLIYLINHQKIGEVIFNSIDLDGTASGMDLSLARMIKDRLSCQITFSGGVGSIEHMQQMIDIINPVGIAAGSFFVFHGINRAVLISYAKPQI